MLEQEQSQSWKCPHNNEWENASQSPATFEKSVMAMAQILYIIYTE